MRTRSKKELAQMRWLATVASRIEAARPDLCGRLCWDTLTYLYLRGDTPQEATETYLKSVKEETK